MESVLHEFARYIDHNLLSVKAATAIVSMVCALLISLIRKRAVSGEAWARYFQWAFIVYALSYSLQFVGDYLISHGLLAASWRTVVFQSVNFIAAAASSVNNLLFLAAARALLKKQSLSPRWAWWAAPLGLLGVIAGQGVLIDFVLRLPDALLSIYSLFWIGYATAVNLSVRRRSGRFPALGAVSSAFLYAVVQTFYTLNPVLATKANPLTLLDSLAFALALPLKLGLFFAGFGVLQRSILVVSSETARRLLTNIIDGRNEYLIGVEMLESIGKEVDAERVDLVIRLPGHNSERVAWFMWSPQEKQTEPQIKTLSPAVSESAGDELSREVAEVLQTRRELIALNQKPQTAKGIWLMNERSSVVTMPIWLQGVVIGCLRLEIVRRQPLGDASVRHIRGLSVLVSSAVQSYRELAAAVEFSNQLAAWRVRREKIDFVQDVGKVTRLLYDILSPLAAILAVKVGFHSFEARGGDLSDVKHNERLKTKLGIEGKNEQKQLLYLGKLTLVVSPKEDDLAELTLCTRRLHREIIGALVSEALLSLARDYLNLVLRDFGVRLNDLENPDFKLWFKEVEETAKRAGLQWVVVKHPTTDKPFGAPQAIDYICQYEKALAQKEQAYVPIPLHPPVAGARCLVMVPLPTLKIKLWLGVRRKGFGPELDTPSPWRTFLERFAEIADSALVRATAVTEMQRLQLEAAQMQGVAAAVVTTGTAIHQLVNSVRDLSFPINTLNEALLIGKLQAEGDLKELITSLQDSANNLLRLLSQLTQAGRANDHRPCSLLEVAQQARQLFGAALKQSGIELQIEVDAGLAIDMPFHVASLALANLVSNAKEAMKRYGTIIRIKAEDAGEMINCYVIDDGPGVDASVRDRIFKLGATTKKDSGGWGLYLVHRSLIENGGYIELTSPGPSGTQFTIRFPKAKERGEYKQLEQFMREANKRAKVQRTYGA